MYSTKYIYIIMNIILFLYNNSDTHIENINENNNAIQNAK